MTDTRLAILDDYQNVAKDFALWHSLQARGVEVTTFTASFGSQQETVAALTPFNMIVAMRERTPFPREVLEKLRNLQLLVTTGMANATIDLAAATERKIVVSGTSGSTTAAPEHTWALLLSFARDLKRTPFAQENGRPP